MRTHTSPVQIRYMEQHKPPFQIIVPGRVFRYEATDASHETNFHQVEGLMVGKNVTLANFKFVIQEFFSRLFPEEKNVKIRLRPSYFPFVEPGLEVDVECIKCSGMPEQSSIRKAHANESCSVCKESGWLEIMGAGMVHPKVFEAVHYNPRDWQGFAFGLGLERVAMIKYNIPDIRLFCSGDLRFIKQFLKRDTKLRIDANLQINLNMKFSFNLIKKLAPGKYDKALLVEKLNLHSFEAVDAGGDVLEVSVPPNRFSDAASHLGLAREASVIFGVKLMIRRRKLLNLAIKIKEFSG